MVHRIDGREEELFLEMWETEEVGGCLTGFDTRVLGDDARATARRIKQHAVEAANEGREAARVVGGDDAVAGAEAVDVADEGLGAAGIAVVGEDAAGVAHEGCEVGGFAAGGGGHVEDALVGLGGERHGGEEGGGGLEDVFPGEVFGGGAEGDGGFEDLETDFRPGAYGLEDDAPVDEGGGEEAAGGAQGVGADDEGAGGFVGFEEGEGFGGGEEGEEFAREEGGVAVVEGDVGGEEGGVVCAGVGGGGEQGGGGEDADGFGDAGAEDLQVGGEAGFGACPGGGVGVGVQRVEVAGDVGLEGGGGGVFELGLGGGGFGCLGE